MTRCKQRAASNRPSKLSDEFHDARVVQRLEQLALPVRRIPVSLTKILRRYAFSHTHN